MSTVEQRPRLVATALRLEYLTVGWNVVEGVVAVAAAVAAGSVVLLAFGIDSFVESASGAILIWRLRAERQPADTAAIERVENRARRMVGASLLTLAAYVTVDAALSLAWAERPESSRVGIALTAVSLGVMWWLAGAKRRVARQLSSRALAADAFQTTACLWLSLVALGGLGLNAAFAWWWADPVAAIIASYFIAREAVAAWRADEA